MPAQKIVLVLLLVLVLERRRIFEDECEDDFEHDPECVLAPLLITPLTRSRCKFVWSPANHSDYFAREIAYASRASDSLRAYLWLKDAKRQEAGWRGQPMGCSPVLLPPFVPYAASSVGGPLVATF